MGLEHGQERVLDAARQKAVLVLCGDEAGHPDPPRRIGRVGHLARRIVGGRKMADLPRLDRIVERPQRLLDRRAGIGLVT